MTQYMPKDTFDEILLPFLTIEEIDALRKASREDVLDLSVKWAVAICEIDYELLMWRDDLEIRKHEEALP